MSIFDFLTMLGGLCLFLFGMNVMGQALERSAGGSLKSLLSKMTKNKWAGFLTGLGVTAVIQSSSATTVMVVGFVNSGLMTLHQAVGVIMGANVGTTVTAWILSLAGISSSNFFIKLLKPSSFTPILALVGIVLYMFLADGRRGRRKDTGLVLLGFATLMFGMETMSGAVAGLKDVPAFTNLFIAFKNPFLGVLAGALLTGIIQSSSASVGILQALSFTGQVSYAAAIPIIMGQNIGTCVTALLSCVGTNKNAKRAAVLHLFFNIIGTVVVLAAFLIVRITLAPAFLDTAASTVGIAVAHSAFNILCTALLLPASGLLEKLVIKLVPDGKKPETALQLDERLIVSPVIALQRSREVTAQMARTAFSGLKNALSLINNYTPDAADRVYKAEEETDKYEDAIGTYLIKLSGEITNEGDSAEVTKLLRFIGDIERISDHALNICHSAEEMQEKNVEFTPQGKAEMAVIINAVSEISDFALKIVTENSIEAARETEPLEQVIDALKEKLRTSHIKRLKDDKCSVLAGYIWTDLLNNLERASDHCSNIAGCELDTAQGELNIHEYMHDLRTENDEFNKKYKFYEQKYQVQ